VPPRYLFTFDSPGRAIRFIESLGLELRQLAIFRTGGDVIVLDGGDQDQCAEICRIARESSGTLVIAR
jgi:hypothetical protein